MTSYEHIEISYSLYIIIGKPLKYLLTSFSGNFMVAPLATAMGSMLESAYTKGKSFGTWT